MDIRNVSAVYTPKTDRVYETALEELGIAFGLAGVPVPETIREDRIRPGTVFLTVLPDSKAVRELLRDGALNLHNIPQELDAYELTIWNGALVLAGNTPRAVLNAAYRLQELAAGGELPDDLHIRETFRFRMRILHQSFRDWPGERAGIRYISHAGASHCCFNHDWHAQRQFEKFVTSPIFPEAEPAAEVRENHSKLRKVIEDCLDYALEPAMWLVAFPCQGGPWVPDETRADFFRRFPAHDAVSDCGTYQGSVLCFSHPLVQEYYRDLIQRFFTDFPEISVLFLFSLDSAGEFCDPGLCPRCRGMSKVAQRDRFVRFLLEEGRRYQPKLRVLAMPWAFEWRQLAPRAGRFSDELLEAQRYLPPGSGAYMAAEIDGWQPERQLHDYLLGMREICRARGQTFVGFDDLHWGDDSVHRIGDIQDYPLGVGAKILRWHLLEADGVMDHWGDDYRNIPCNSVACREFFINPLADAVETAGRIARRQFGEAAAPHVLEAWRSLERAHAILSNCCSITPYQWPNWYMGLYYMPTPEGFAKFGRYYYSPPMGREFRTAYADSLIDMACAPKQAGPVIYNGGNLADLSEGIHQSWRRAFPYYMNAAASMREAIRAAQDGPLFYAFWWPDGKETPSRREHLIRQERYLSSMGFFGGEIGLHYGLLAVYERAGRDPEAYFEQAKALLAEDIEACRNASEYFASLEALGLRGNGCGLAESFKNKAERLREYI